jgi:hypothetical protein
MDERNAAETGGERVCQSYRTASWARRDRRKVMATNYSLCLSGWLLECLAACLAACLLVWLLAYLLAGYLDCRTACQTTGVFVQRFALLSDRLFVWPPVRSLAYLTAPLLFLWLLVWLLGCLLAWLLGHLTALVGWLSACLFSPPLVWPFACLFGWQILILWKLLWYHP